MKRTFAIVAAVATGAAALCILFGWGDLWEGTINVREVRLERANGVVELREVVRWGRESGIRHGITKQLHPNGNVKMLARYEKSELVGVVTYFNLEGDIEMQTLHKGGVLHDGKKRPPWWDVLGANP